MIQRIIEYRLSPLYVSVHATDPTVRRYLLRNPDRARHHAAAPRVCRARHRVSYPDRHVPGSERRTGAAADPRRSVRFRPRHPRLLGGAGRAHRILQASSRAGAHRRGVPGRHRADRGAGARLREPSGAIHWAFGADELYLRAGVELPPAEIYDGFDQVENGVGSVRWLQQRIEAVAGRARAVGREADRRRYRHRHEPADAAWCWSRSPSITGSRVRADPGGQYPLRTPASPPPVSCRVWRCSRRFAAGGISTSRCFRASRSMMMGSSSTA